MRSTFFQERKNSKFMHLFLLNRVKARWSKNRAAQGFHYINSFISNFFGPNSKTCTCEVCVAWGRVSRGLTVKPGADFLSNQILCQWQIARNFSWERWGLSLSNVLLLPWKPFSCYSHAWWTTTSLLGFCIYYVV